MKVFSVLGIIVRDSLKIIADIPHTADVVFIVRISRSAMYYVYTVNFFAYSSHRESIHSLSLMITNQGEILSKTLHRFSCNISVILSDFNQNYNVAINFPTTAKYDISQNSIQWAKRRSMQADR